ncbi:hypothetical protein DIU31_027670 [Mucilaginibacter rubeus]|uniref:3-isopropylmalate dehydratase n=1 Tax=Mucilaginibacter rubeus TaxID=2027860 RepID=A0AAE6MKV6_9SPHI|nr:hypothetical protein [Mucilaginibacter rubeus]QEM07100.1 hypothetical protein DIU31_027670 [Mucilaginibacter rubeus]QTE43757.1 hypothetical protein J3L19_33395 [Mucilaginibacter rubeus]QTE50356.1 hypothetical protein J3L21_33350 [Mucilaginibacter rubeus]QTE55443.1 hypothetical protein J3L23_24965 [Mucilaginibacter rubeus]QTE65095.1 hypothetical protein J3L22_08855 [Mucilaginibacter rubeus]
MKIIDLEGKEIAVTDLSLAILQADDYRHYRHSNAEFAEFDDKQRRYWEDIYQKLLKLKNE